MTSQIPAQPQPGSPAKKAPAKKAPAKKAPAKKATARQAPAAQIPVVHQTVQSGLKPGVEEWPPREWRETTRSAGHRQALYVTLSMVAMFAILVAVNIWGSKQG